MRQPHEFAICVPTWNSLEYLKLLVRSIRQNSAFTHAFYIHDNASNDGTRDWLQLNGEQHTFSAENEGFCGVNHAIAKALDDGHENIMIMNSDMVAMSAWDIPIMRNLKRFARDGIEKYTLSCRLVEPIGNNPEYAIADYGKDAKSLRYGDLRKARVGAVPDTIQYSHPILFPAKMLKQVKGFDANYWPGWASDHDIAKACHKAGCRHFLRMGDSHVYHFSSATFKKLPEEDRAKHGQDIFQRKWKQSVDEFRAEIGVTKPYKG